MTESGSKLLLVCIAAIIVVALANGDASSTATATPTAICNVDVSELLQCLPAITGKSPTKSCCAVMKKANLQCLCNYKSQFTNFGIDPAKAMALPKKCGRKLPHKCTKKF